MREKIVTDLENQIFIHLFPFSISLFLHNPTLTHINQILNWLIYIPLDINSYYIKHLSERSILYNQNLNKLYIQRRVALRELIVIGKSNQTLVVQSTKLLNVKIGFDLYNTKIVKFT